MGIDLASGSQGWELVAESPSAISSGQPLRAEVRYSQLKPRAACPKGPSGVFLELPDRGQNPPQGSPKARRWLLKALGPCLRPGIRHGADGVLESREGSLLGVTAMIGCCMAALCPAAAGSLQRSMAEPAETGGCLSRKLHESFWKPLPRRKISPAAQTVQADSRSRHTHRQENVPKCRQTSKMLLAGLGYMLCLQLGKLKHSIEPKPHAANLLQSWRRSLSGPDPGPCPGDATRRPRQLWKVAQEASTTLSAGVST
ncbi:hypothetical protein J3E69DRAFT_377839 [Trichoderma sp. SZMC 28015]